MFKKPEPDPGLEKVISDCESELLSHDADSKEYKEVLARYMTLKAFQADRQPKRLSRDALLGAATSLGGILLIVAYEHGHVITSKATGFVKKAF